MKLFKIIINHNFFFFFNLFIFQGDTISSFGAVLASIIIHIFFSILVLLTTLPISRDYKGYYY